MEIWEKLINVLEEMLATYGQVLEMSRKKREILVAAKPKELDALTRQEELLLIRLGKQEAARQAVILAAAAEYGHSQADLTLSGAAGMAGPPFDARLRELGAALLKLTDELSAINRLNERLIKQSLDFVNYNLNILTQSRVGNTYQAKGESGVESRIVIDAKI